MALFCTLTKLSPSEYRKLTVREFQAFITAIEDRGPDIEGIF
jgi:hypothetical protein